MNGIYGPLLENFTCEPRVFTAVEVTAGSRWEETDCTDNMLLNLVV